MNDQLFVIPNFTKWLAALVNCKPIAKRYRLFALPLLILRMFALRNMRHAKNRFSIATEG